MKTVFSGFLQAVSNMDLKNFFSVKALINGQHEHDGLSSPNSQSESNNVYLISFIIYLISAVDFIMFAYVQGLNDNIFS